MVHIRSNFCEQLSNVFFMVLLIEVYMMQYKRKHSWLEHVFRHDGLLRDILEGRMKGKSASGRKRLNMMRM